MLDIFFQANQYFREKNGVETSFSHIKCLIEVSKHVLVMNFLGFHLLNYWWVWEVNITTNGKISELVCCDIRLNNDCLTCLNGVRVFGITIQHKFPSKESWIKSSLLRSWSYIYYKHFCSRMSSIENNESPSVRKSLAFFYVFYRN